MVNFESVFDILLSFFLIVLEKEENPEQQNGYHHYLSTKKIDPMVVAKGSIFCIFAFWIKGGTKVVKCYVFEF